MQSAHHLFGFFARYREAQVIAAGTVADQADIERIEHAEYLFAYAAGPRQLVADDRHQRRFSSTSTRHSDDSSVSSEVVSRLPPTEVAPVVSMVSAMLTSEVVIRSTEMLWRARMLNTSAETACVQHVQAVQRQQRLLAAQRQRAEQRRIFGGVAHQRAAGRRILARADKTGMSLRTAGNRVAGCRTLAPKVAISAASSKPILSMRLAAGTTRGSVV